MRKAHEIECFTSSSGMACSCSGMAPYVLNRRIETKCSRRSNLVAGSSQMGHARVAAASTPEVQKRTDFCKSLSPWAPFTRVCLPLSLSLYRDRRGSSFRARARTRRSRGFTDSPGRFPPWGSAVHGPNGEVPPVTTLGKTKHSDLLTVRDSPCVALVELQQTSIELQVDTQTPALPTLPLRAAN